ncbi:MAG: YncE family protein, partial [Candidatus Nitrosocosmicus sp.]|nr:YncE family protein [Candidatus Nitrosocosmicus sp.]
IDGSSNSVIDTITVGNGPLGLAYNDNNHHMYVANAGDNTVSVIDGSSNSVIDTIIGGDQPAMVAYNGDNNHMYVTNILGDTVSVIDGSSNSVIDTITVGNGPLGLAYNDNNHHMYVANAGDNTVSVIDGSSNNVIDTITVGSFPFGLAYNEDRNYIYITNLGDDAVYAISSSNNNKLYTYHVGNGPSGIAYNPNNHLAYVANSNDGTVSVIVEFIPPFAEAGPHQIVASGDTVQLDGSGSSDKNDFDLTYSWTQTEGPAVILDDHTSITPTFTAPNTTDDEIVLEFQLIVKNEYGETSEPDWVTITVQPKTIEEQPRTIEEILKGILNNPLDINNSIESSNEIKDILTDDNPNNDRQVCDILGKLSDKEEISDLQDILRC